MRSYLECFLFDGVKQRQKVGSLSGGERARVALAKILKQRRQPALARRAHQRPGRGDARRRSRSCCARGRARALIVSHDRYFLDRVATSILAFEGAGKVVRYPGNYNSLRRPAGGSGRRRAERARGPWRRAQRANSRQKRPRGTSRSTYAERLELERIVDVIAALESARDLARERARAARASMRSRAHEAKQLGLDLESARANFTALARWEAARMRGADSGGGDARSVRAHRHVLGGARYEARA